MILDGAADEPLPDLDGRTPLQAATTPVLADMAKRGRIGAVRTLDPEWGADPEAALAGLLGYPPREFFHGRGPFEAAGLEVDLDPRDLAFRMDLVSSDGAALQDPTSGRIGRGEGRELVEHLAAKLRIRSIQFYPGRGYRNVLVWRDGPSELRTTSPRDFVGEPLTPHMAAGDRAERLHQVIWDSYELLHEHPINRRRRDEGKPAATMIWPWSAARPVRLPGFGPLHGMGAALVAGTYLPIGIGRLAGLHVSLPDGATGFTDTDYQAKARAALTALQTYDLAIIHVEAPNEAALDGDYEAKVDALERIDERLLGTVFDRIGKLDDFRVLVMPDHTTSCLQKRALPGWVPFVLAGSRVKKRGQRLPFDERASEEAEWRIDEPWHLMRVLLEPEAD